MVLNRIRYNSISILEYPKGNFRIIQGSCEDIDPFLVDATVNGPLVVYELARKMEAKVIYASTSSLHRG